MPFALARAGERVLDIGCGCGATSLALAKTVGAAGRVHGVDVSRPMLRIARERAMEEGANVVFLEADASAQAFRPEWDLVFSRFGVMFFADPVAAFANIRGALAPGGRLVFVCWRALLENVWAARPLAAAMDLLPPLPPTDQNSPGPFAFADESRLIGILSQAGFSDVDVQKLDTVMNMGATLDDAAHAALSIGPLARASGDLGEEIRETIRGRVRGALGDFETPAGIVPPAACWLARARN